MLGDSEQRAVEILNGVAAFAAILVRRVGELTAVHVFVAVHAVRKLHIVNSGLAGRKMALCAFHFEVLAFQRVARACVLLHSEQRRFPALDRVALRAFSLFSRFANWPLWMSLWQSVQFAKPSCFLKSPFK